MDRLWADFVARFLPTFQMWFDWSLQYLVVVFSLAVGSFWVLSARSRTT